MTWLVIVTITLAQPLSTLAQTADRVNRSVNGCPDVSGRFRVTGSAGAVTDSDAWAEALAALRAQQGGFTGSEVALSLLPSGSLEVRVKSGSTGVMPASPNAVLSHGDDFSCYGGWLSFKRAERASRKREQGWYEGLSTVSISRGPSGPSGALFVQVRFSGNQRSITHIYDSARISLPKLGTGIVLRESMRWPDISEPVPETPAREVAREPEPKAVLAVRTVLNSRVLGNMMLGSVTASGDAVLVTLTSHRSADVSQFEDRLRAASVAYEMKTQPIWTNNTYYMQLTVWPEGTAAGRSWRPSVLRVEHELRSLRPLATVDKVSDVGSAYVASISMLGSENLDVAIARIKANSNMFGAVDVIGDSMRADASRSRTVQLRLHLR